MADYKGNGTVQITPFNAAEHGYTPQPPVNGAKDGQTERKNSRAYRDIAVACIVISLPMVVLSALLLGLVYTKRVKQNDESPSALQLPNAAQSDASAYLVDYSATRLITIASWTSTVAPFLPGFIMILFSFPASRRLLKTTNAGLNQSLPTPYQIGLYLQLLTASPGSLWQCLKYKSWKQYERSVPFLARTLLVVVASTLLGYLILAADTWLHVATSTVLYHSTTPVNGADLSQHGRALYSDQCSKRSDILDNPCSIDMSASTTFITNAGEAQATLNNVSSLNQISSFVHEGTTYAFLLPAAASQIRDFRTSTFAVSTKCRPVTKDCNMNGEVGAFTPFKCTDGFQGDATANEDKSQSPRKASSPIGITLLEDSEGNTNVSTSSKDINPFYLGTWARVEDTIIHQVGTPTNPKAEALTKDPDIVIPSHGGMAWVLHCETSVYDLIYTWLNGSVSSPSLTLSNGTTGGLVAATTIYEHALPKLEIAAILSSYSGSAQELATKWADQYSGIALALSSGVMTPRPNILEQIRTQQLVARVPRAPLYALVLLNLIYAALGVLLAIYALLFTRIRSGTGAARQRLTVHGVVAECFEHTGRAALGRNKVEEMFEEREGRGGSARLGVREDGDGGMRFVRI